MTDAQIIAYIQILLGSISPETLPEEIILTFLTMEKIRQNYPAKPERLGVVLYNTLVACVRWLIAREISSGESSISERLEKIGSETIQVKGGSTYQSWKDFLDWLLDNPDYVDPSLNANSGLVIIGGVRNDEFHRIKDHPNSRGPFDVGGIIPQTGAPNNPRRYPKRYPF